MNGLASLANLDLSRLDLSLLPPKERDELARLLENRFGGETLDAFIRRTRPAEPPPPHLRILIDVFERARTKGGLRVCISMPPRAGKSTTVRSAIAWWLTHSPADLCMYVSYNADIAAREHGYKTRAEAERAGVALAHDRAASDDWATIYGGGMRSCGMNAGITGRGATGFVVVDDPFAGFQEGESPTIRDKVWSTFWSDVMTRVEGWASVIVVHTRWNEDDLIGRLSTLPGWEVISIPALAESSDDVLGRKPGESFWPERHQYSVEQLEKLRVADPYSFAALYQQKPQGRGHRLFGDPAYFDPTKIDLTGCFAIIGVDPAASEQTSADYSAAVLQAIRHPKDIHKATSHILNVLHRQKTIPQFARELLAFQRANWNAPLVIETVGAFKAVPQNLREAAPGLIIHELTTPEELHGDKFLRAQGVAAAWNAGRALVPNNGPPWLEPYLTEMRRFTGVRDKYADQVDATAHGWNALVGGPPLIKRGAVAAPERWR